MVSIRGSFKEIYKGTIRMLYGQFSKLGFVLGSLLIRVPTMLGT